MEQALQTQELKWKIHIKEAESKSREKRETEKWVVMFFKNNMLLHLCIHYTYPITKIKITTSCMLKPVMQIKSEVFHKAQQKVYRSLPLVVAVAA